MSNITIMQCESCYKILCRLDREHAEKMNVFLCVPCYFIKIVLGITTIEEYKYYLKTNGVNHA